MSGSTQDVELSLPPRVGAFAATLAYLLIATFVLLAAGNLIFLPEVSIVSALASVFWLLLVGGIVITNVLEEGGVRQFVINRMGIFAAQQFIRAEPNEKEFGISIGYVLLGRSFSYLRLPVTAITSVQWSTGQATALAGRDMQDWSVAIWYNHHQGPRRKPFPGVRNEEVYLIGPTGEKEQVEAFGLQLVAFLTRLGVEFGKGRDACEFNTASRVLPCEPSTER